MTLKLNQLIEYQISENAIKKYKEMSTKSHCMIPTSHSMQEIILKIRYFKEDYEKVFKKVNFFPPQTHSCYIDKIMKN